VVSGEAGEVEEGETVDKKGCFAIIILTGEK